MVISVVVASGVVVTTVVVTSSVVVGWPVVVGASVVVARGCLFNSNGGFYYKRYIIQDRLI